MEQVEAHDLAQLNLLVAFWRQSQPSQTPAPSAILFDADVPNTQGLLLRFPMHGTVDIDDAHTHLGFAQLIHGDIEGTANGVGVVVAAMCGVIDAVPSGAVHATDR